MLIAVLGPDGTGKTTLSKLIAERYSNIEYVYFGNNKQSRKYKYFSDFIKKERVGIFFTLMKYIFIFVNDLYYFRLAKKRNIIADRCPIDRLIITKVKDRKWRHYFHKITSEFFPNPDFIILLEGDADVLYQRKKEVSKALIQQYISFYKEYIKNNSVNHILIDTCQNGIDATFQIAKEAIYKQLI